MNLIKETVSKIAKAKSEEEIRNILESFENKTKENLVIDILLEKRNKKIEEQCWQGSCVFTESSPEHMKCWHENYSVNQCKKDNLE